MPGIEQEELILLNERDCKWIAERFSPGSFDAGNYDAYDFKREKNANYRESDQNETKRNGKSHVEEDR